MEKHSLQKIAHNGSMHMEGTHQVKHQQQWQGEGQQKVLHVGPVRSHSGKAMPQGRHQHSSGQQAFTAQAAAGCQE